MITRDDRVFCGLIASSYGLTSKKMPYAMYILQAVGFELNYRYSVRFDSLRSHGLISVIGDLTSWGYIEQDYSVTDSGYEKLETFFVTAEEADVISAIMELCENCSKEELYLICTTDLMIQEAIKGGSETLIREKEHIKSTIKNLCGNYSEEDFNESIRIMHILRGGTSNEKEK